MNVMENLSGKRGRSYAVDIGKYKALLFLQAGDVREMLCDLGTKQNVTRLPNPVRQTSKNKVVFHVIKCVFSKVFLSFFFFLCSKSTLAHKPASTLINQKTLPDFVCVYKFTLSDKIK